ncbi:melanoma cell adhesion molecule b isoform X1 [Corythoichthys intestinalis]|uniref:melanoma cell adhesion molecule b isoform X1 n=1 Tax=Corythoichthys intestinalis TaxID=161448 RepID=UPI0025A4E403|nr:melanoma cell adhesion molecule b isoform X1 [Corythoichthys intestinalis]
MDTRLSVSLLAGLVILLHGFTAWAAVEVNMEDRVEVFKGETAQITCMFTSDDGIGALTIQWFYVLKTGEKQSIYYQDATVQSVERGTQFTDRISVNVTAATGEVLLTVNDVQLKDQLEFICLVMSLTDGFSEGRTKLLVFERPDYLSIEGVQTGIYANEDTLSRIGFCEVKNGFPKPNITWYRNNTPLQAVPDAIKVVHSTTTESSGLFSVSSELSLKVMKEDKDAQFYCEVTYLVPGGTKMIETNLINITVYYPSTAVHVWVESPKGKIKEGDSITFHCHGNGNTPSSVYTIKHNDNEYGLENNMLVLENVTRRHSGIYECTSMDMETYEELLGNTTVFVNYLDSAVVLPTKMELDQGEEMTATCNALSSLQTHTAWFKDGQEVSVGHTLRLKDATFDLAGTYTCVVTVPEIDGMEKMQPLRVNVKGAPEIMKPEQTDFEESLANKVDLTCQVRGFPAPDVIWTTSDGKVLEPTSHTEEEDSVYSVLSMAVTSDLTTFCNATNKYGADALTFNIKAIVHTTAAATTTTSTSATTSTSTTTRTSVLSTSTESSGVIIAVIIICILLLAILGSVLYFLYKKGKICGRSGKQDLTKEKSSKDNIVVEMKSDNTEDAVLLGVNGEKLPYSSQ